MLQHHQPTLNSQHIIFFTARFGVWGFGVRRELTVMYACTKKVVNSVPVNEDTIPQLTARIQGRMSFSLPGKRRNYLSTHNQGIGKKEKRKFTTFARDYQLPNLSIHIQRITTTVETNRYQLTTSNYQPYKKPADINSQL